MALKMLRTLIWIDDDIKKHTKEYELIADLRIMLVVCTDYGILFNPSKFCPFIT